MIKHLKESTDVTKSNRQLKGSFIFAGVFCLLFVLTRIFVPLLLFIPETVSTGLQINKDWISAVIRGSTAIILLIPPLIMYKK